MRAVEKTNNPQSPGAAELLDEAGRSRNSLLDGGVAHRGMEVGN